MWRISQCCRTAVLPIFILALPAAAQVDQQRAAMYFREAAALCDREGGRLWDVSLCGPMVFADEATHSVATNRPAPAARQPMALGFANAAFDWGGVRWAAIVWSMIPADEHARGRIMLHELYHRIQPQLGLVVRDGDNGHLDTLDGRYWMELEWRALAKALAATGSGRSAAVRDALAFRFTRRKLFPAAAENERLAEVNEGLAQYTGTVASAASSAEAAADAIDQLREVAQNPSFVRTFAYASGTAYGILLDGSSPGWTRRVKASDDLSELLIAAGRIQPAADAEAASKLYGAAELRAAEERRETEQQARIADLRHRFVDGPVLVLPIGHTSTLANAGVTPVAGAGTVYPTYRATGEWGSLEAASVLISPDRSKLTLPAPANLAGVPLIGDGWTLKVAPGWVLRPGTRHADFELVRDTDPPGKRRE